MTETRVRLLAAVLALGTAVALFGPVAASSAMSPEARACGGSNTNVQGEFDLKAGKEIWTVFPAMMRAPELEDSDIPIHVVVFEGGFDLVGMVIGDGSKPAPTAADVICVIPEGGRPRIYGYVSRAGSDWK
ncbi:MAG: hypothetical protein V4515_14615 [Chloroflexota bacterium]